MNNLIFVTDTYVHPSYGGIARITGTIAQALHLNYGYTCYSFYAGETTCKSTNEHIFAKEQQWSTLDYFQQFVQSFNHCIIIIQSPCKLAADIFHATFPPSVKIVSVFHGTPGFELVPLRTQVACYRLLHGIDWKWTLKQTVLKYLTYMLGKHFIQSMLHSKYTLPYGKADRIVLLSQGLIPAYQAIAPGDEQFFTAIPNALSFPAETISPSKRHEVLVVARLDDWHKRIFDILRIWRLLQHKVHNDWTLHILGDGTDLPFYKSYVRHHNIPNIVFEGRKDPFPLYQRASLFAMTSACEGWGLTLTEAQSCGCIPVVYDTFCAAHDIIEDGKNGCLVEADNQAQFVATLMQLMQDEARRERMSEQAILSCQRYSVDNIAKKWNDLFEELTSPKKNF